MPRRACAPPRRLLLGVAFAALVAAGACQPAGPRHSGPPPSGKGEFLATCAFSHRLADDPIVHPGHAGMSHHHDFFGNTSVHAGSTTESMAAAPTNCDPVGDPSAYWVPTLLVGGSPVAPDRVTIYYTSDLTDPRDTQTLPYGLRMIAGSPLDQPRDDPGVAKWSCLGDATSGASIVSCPPGSALELLLRFPDCWDGSRLDSGDHKSHMAYSAGGRCPAGHPVGVPRIEFKLRYPTTGGAGATLSNGSGYAAHGDVWNLWDPGELQRRITNCLHTGRKCDEVGTPT